MVVSLQEVAPLKLDPAIKSQDDKLCIVISKVAVRLRNLIVGATTGGCPYDSMPFFVIFVLFLRALRG